MSIGNMISSDSHIIEPPDLWTHRLDAKHKDRGPRVVSEEDGDFWYVGDVRSTSFSGIQAGVRFEDREKLRPSGRWEEVREGSYNPEAFVKENESDGVNASVLYPTAGFSFYGSVFDGELLSAIFRAFNDWLIDFCSANPKQLLGVGMVNVDNVDEAVGEMERIRKNGLVGAMIPAYSPPDRTYNLPDYDALWTAAQDLDIPLSLHIGTNRAARGQGFRHFNNFRASEMAAVDYWVRVSLGDMIFGGVFERYPSLKIVCVEYETSWAPTLLERMDYTYTQRASSGRFARFKTNLLPSDFFHRNVFLSFQEDHLGVKDRAIIGVDNLMWGSDYPHTESTFPRSKEIVAKILEGVPEDEKRKIVHDNAARVYNLN